MKIAESKLSVKNGSHEKVYEFLFEGRELSMAIKRDSIPAPVLAEFDRFIEKMGEDVMLASKVEATVDFLEVDKKEEPFDGLPEAEGILSVDIKAHIGVVVEKSLPGAADLIENFFDEFTEEFLQILMPLGPKLFDHRFKESLVIEVAKFNHIIPEDTDGRMMLQEYFNDINHAEQRGGN